MNKKYKNVLKSFAFVLTLAAANTFFWTMGVTGQHKLASETPVIKDAEIELSPVLLNTSSKDKDDLIAYIIGSELKFLGTDYEIICSETEITVNLYMYGVGKAIRNNGPGHDEITHSWDSLVEDNKEMCARYYDYLKYADSDTNITVRLLDETDRETVLISSTNGETRENILSN